MNEVFVKVADFELLKKYFKKYDLVSIDELCSLIEELDIEIDNLEEELEQLRDDIRENYTEKKFNPYKEYGLRERDFY